MKPIRPLLDRITYLKAERDKLISAIAYGVRRDGNLKWAEAKLAQVQAQLAAIGGRSKP